MCTRRPSCITEPLSVCPSAAPTSYAFVDFSTADYASLALGLNTIKLLTSPLRFWRPNNYQPIVGAESTGESAAAAEQPPTGSAAPAAADPAARTEEY